MKCFQHLLDAKRAGKTVIVVSHNMIDINRVCDRIVVINGGRKTHDGDVSAAIATYEDQLQKQHGCCEQRASNASAWIERIELLDSLDRQRAEFTTGEDLIGEVKLCAVSRVSNARLIVHVTTPSVGTLGSFASPHQGFSFDIEPPNVFVRFQIRNLPLLIGSYSIMLSLYGPDIKDFFHSITNAATFKIIAPPVDTFGYGVCHSVGFDHVWRLCKEQTNRQRPTQSIPQMGFSIEDS
jgi:hypothetical protein